MLPLRPVLLIGVLLAACGLTGQAQFKRPDLKTAWKAYQPDAKGKDDVPAAQAKLAELEKRIAEKEKDLAALRAEAAALRGRIADAKSPALLTDLLNQLPKERWPSGSSDSLKLQQAKEWLKDNITGRRASHSVVIETPPVSP